ncbi:ferredoxin reductase family protein [Azotobacter beijerinckii]|uniref:ferredoxin reductase family protein n=1 Tax=Azotobacter beijerinckii TaxID=170623 RepID=UPI002954FDAD|nr:ferric reductase-like transmembrane domain-containing protein [Azotobacter beijerinckii]MDV7210716.1 ferric reductase-like transmembrane domain-containing protein [Azotobacter beijerinckii]
MKNIRITCLALFGGLSLLWLLADNLLGAPYEFFALRRALVNYTGILAVGAMSVGIFLAIRPGFLESFLGGLDKGYRLHKWLGISALALSVAHWLWVKVPKWMVGWGWLERPARKAAGSEDVGVLVGFLRSQRGLAEQVGEWAFYAAVVLILLALFKRFPYRYFFKTHRLLAVVYLTLVFHSVVLMNTAYWASPLGAAMAALLLAGTLAAGVSLLRRVGDSRRALGHIEALELHRDNRVLGVDVRLQDRWAGHQAGQFAFVTFDPAEGPHPFTISSAWQGDGRLRFHIKGIGDYTETLPQTLKVGDPLTVEGPYGRFDFAGGKTRQIWVAGGIGITPFIARLQALARQPDSRSIDLFYSTAAPDQTFIERLQQLAGQAGVRLHVLVSGRDERLSGERLRERMPEWHAADVWFCGPAGFGRALRESLIGSGLAAADFHQELFEMR